MLMLYSNLIRREVYQFLNWPPMCLKIRSNKKKEKKIRSHKYMQIKTYLYWVEKSFGLNRFLAHILPMYCSILLLFAPNIICSILLLYYLLFLVVFWLKVWKIYIWKIWKVFFPLVILHLLFYFIYYLVGIKILI